MKFAIFFLTFLINPVFAEPITCLEKSTLYVFFKLKDKITGRMAEKGLKKSDPLDCKLMATDEFDDLQADREKKLKECQNDRVHQESKSLAEFIKQQTISSLDDSPCMFEFFQGKFSDLVRSSTIVPNIQALCKAYAPVHQDLYQRSEYCQKLGEASKNPNSCEIPDENGKCPGEDPPTAQDDNTSIQNPSNALHWGKVKKK